MFNSRKLGSSSHDSLPSSRSPLVYDPCSWKLRKVVKNSHCHVAIGPTRSHENKVTINSRIEDRSSVVVLRHKVELKVVVRAHIVRAPEWCRSPSAKHSLHRWMGNLIQNHCGPVKVSKRIGARLGPNAALLYRQFDLRYVGIPSFSRSVGLECHNVSPRTHEATMGLRQMEEK